MQRLKILVCTCHDEDAKLIDSDLICQSFDFVPQIDLTLSIDSILPYQHLLIQPEGTAEHNLKGWDLWNRFNKLLWEEKIEQDTAENLAEVFSNQTEVNI